LSSQEKSYCCNKRWHKTLLFVVLVFITNLLLRFVDQQFLNPAVEPAWQGAAISSAAEQSQTFAEEKSEQESLLAGTFPGWDTRKRFKLIMQRLVGEENRALQWQHRRLSQLNPRDASFSDRVWMQSLAHDYNIDCSDPCSALDLYAPLLERVNPVPLNGLLAAAAVSSRFGVDVSAQRHRNLFVLWQRTAPPRFRAEGVYPWRSFISWRDSLKAFVLHINIDPAFARFRQLRAQHKSEAEQVEVLRQALMRQVSENKKKDWQRVEKELLNKSL